MAKGRSLSDDEYIDSSVNIYGWAVGGIPVRRAEEKGPGIDCRSRRCHQLSWKRYQENMTEGTNTAAYHPNSRAET